MTQLDVTWLRALKVFWSLLWRMALCVPPAALLSIVVYDASLELLLSRAETWQIQAESTLLLALGPLGLGAGVLLGTWLTKVVLKKAYSDFRIVLEGPPKRLKIEPRLQAPERRAGRASLSVDAAAIAAVVRRHSPAGQQRRHRV